MGEGRAAGRVGSDFLSAIKGRVGSGQRFAGSGPRKVTRVTLLWPSGIGTHLGRNRCCEFDSW